MNIVKMLSKMFKIKYKRGCRVLRFYGITLWKTDLSKLKKEKYPKYLKEWYKIKTGNELDLDNPKTFNEKIQWLKLYDAHAIKTKLTDKYLVRSWVAETIGEEYLIPLLGVWDKFDDIDFDKLPDKFVLKCNHGCHYNIIVTDKSNLDIADARKKINKWMKENYAFMEGFEMQYDKISRKIIAEEYIGNEKNNIADWKIWCFNGKAKYIQHLTDRDVGLKTAFFDTDWNKQSFATSHLINTNEIEKPEQLKKMLELAEILSKEFKYVRADFYISPNQEIKFGEMTFTPTSGICNWNEPDIDRMFGEWIDLSKIDPKFLSKNAEISKTAMAAE